MAGRRGVKTALYRLEDSADRPIIWLSGDWARAEHPPASETVAQSVGSAAAVVVIDGSALDNAHPRIAAFIHGLRDLLSQRGMGVELQHLPENVSALMQLARPAPARAAAAPRRPNSLARLGMRVRRRWGTAADTAHLVGEALVLTPKLVSGRAQTRWRDFVDLIHETGAASLPVVTVVNLLIGAVIGFIGAVQLKTFGAGMYLADLVGVASAREMAAIMTAFIMAGRIGATFAAHLATMEANEEIDALRMIGVSPFEFLALPRLAAMTLMMPLLYLYGAVLAIIGGMVVANIVLGTPPASFFERLQDAVSGTQFVIGFVKSVAFGVLIALTSCYIGLHAGRNAAEVGRAATRTVVACIIGIISIDALAALCTNALGI
jgi:phospholipid/cholesterol/gamma-HCH transport system permease protein